MAITFTLTKQTPNALAYLFTQDGGAGTVVTIDNASMVADLIAGPLSTVPGLNSDVNPNSQALGRQHMLGDASAIGAGQDLTNIAHCACFVQQRTGAGGVVLAWDCDADVDGVSPNRYELIINSSAVTASSAILLIKFQHSFTR